MLTACDSDKGLGFKECTSSIIQLECCLEYNSTKKSKKLIKNISFFNQIRIISKFWQGSGEMILEFQVAYIEFPVVTEVINTGAS